MAKIKAYMRVAKGSKSYKIAVTGKPTSTPLDDGSYRPKVLPTVFFTLELEIDDDDFNPLKVPVIALKVKSKKKNILAYEEPDVPEFDENCLPECTPGDHKCGK
jgi:hypothetical protein